MGCEQGYEHEIHVMAVGSVRDDTYGENIGRVQVFEEGSGEWGVIGDLMLEIYLVRQSP